MEYFNYSKEILSEMKIFDLRNIGTQVGVKSPTSLKKDVLIEEILKITMKFSKEEIKERIMEQGGKRKPGRPQKPSKEEILRDASSIVIQGDASTAMPFVFSNPEQAFLYGKTTAEPEDTEETEETMPEMQEPLFNLQSQEELQPPQPIFPELPKIQPKIRPEEKPRQPEEKKPFQDRIKKPKQVVPAEENNIGQPEKPAPDAVTETKEGVLEILPDNYGFLRATNYEAGDGDAYISVQKIKQYALRKGDWIKAEVQKSTENRPRVLNILSVNGRNPELSLKRKNFDTLTPIYPNQRFKLELPGVKTNDYAIRCIDMIAPIGKGQRAMIVSPPKAGKTTFLKKVARSISNNYPEAHLMVLLIDERPEEVTDMQRCIDGEVIYSTFDEMPEHHTKAAELVLERAKRLVELGEDVVILLDSLTRLARAYNLTIAPTGRTLSGGIDPGALHSPKRFFGAARNIEYGGSLTIIATALVDTGSRMDDVIYEEFKGTGNMELHLDRRLSEKRIFPAIDLYKSSTRMEELLLDQTELQGAWAMRKLLGTGDSVDATENLINMLVKTKTNREFLEQVNLKVMALQKQGFPIR